MKKLRSLILNSILILLLIIGLALVFNNKIKYFILDKGSHSYQLSKMSRSDVVKNSDQDGEFDFDSVKPINTTDVIKSRFSNKKLPPIGGIAIPSVGINLPIFKGLSNEALLYGAGTMSPNQKMGEGNYALASHRADRPDLLFTPLENISNGDLIYLTDLENVYTYKVLLKVRVQPTEVEYLDEKPNQKLLTLITCGEIEGITRIIVQAELTSKTSINEMTDKMENAFNLDQRTY